MKEDLPFYGGMDLLQVAVPIEVVLGLVVRAEREGVDVQDLAGRLLAQAAA